MGLLIFIGLWTYLFSFNPFDGFFGYVGFLILVACFVGMWLLAKDADRAKEAASKTPEQIEKERKKREQDLKGNMYL